MKISFKPQIPGGFTRAFSFSTLVGELRKYKINKGDILNIRSEINSIEPNWIYYWILPGREGEAIVYDVKHEFCTYLVSILIELDSL